MEDLLSSFGEVFINDVRDRTIRNFDMIIAGKMRDESSQKLSETINQMSIEHRQLIDRIVPHIVDLCIHNMLCMVEGHDNIDILIESQSISEISDGLSGELYTEDGWIQKYSKQRYEEI